MMKHTIALSLALAVAAPFVPGCEREGPAERAGNKLDHGVDDATD